MPRDGSRACFVTGGAAAPGWSGASSCSYQASLPLPAFPAPKKATFNPKSGARPGWGVVRAALDACHSWTELWLVSAWRGVARCGVFFAPSLWGGVGGVVPCVGSRWVPLGWDNKTPWEKSGFCAAVGPPAPGGGGRAGSGAVGAVSMVGGRGQGGRWVSPPCGDRAGGGCHRGGGTRGWLWVPPRVGTNLRELPDRRGVCRVCPVPPPMPLPRWRRVPVQDSPSRAVALR